MGRAALEDVRSQEWLRYQRVRTEKLSCVFKETTPGQQARRCV